MLKAKLKRLYLKFLIRFVVPTEILESLALNFVSCFCKDAEYHEMIQKCLKVACEWLAEGNEQGWDSVIMQMANEYKRNRH